MKILLMTQWFDPEPTFKGLLFAQKLKEKGNDVEVITGFPNYPGGKVYDGYKIKLYQKEVIDGVIIHRVPLYPSHDRSAVKRIANYITFFLSAFICGIFKAKRPDIIYSYHPPLTTAVAAMLVGFFKRRPFIIDIQDLWPDTLAATGMLNNQRVLKLVSFVCQWVYRRAQKIVVLSPGFKVRLAERGVPNEKIQVIYNWCDEDVLRAPKPCSISLPQNGSRNLVFAGNLGHAQGLPAILRAAKELEKRNCKMNIVLVGDGVAKSEAQHQVKDEQINNVFFLDRVPMTEIGSLLAASDVLLVHLTGDPLFSITIPSRTQAYMAVGKPVLMAIDGDAANIVIDAKCGEVSKPDCAESLSNAIEILATKSDEELVELGRNAKDYYEQNMSLSSGVNVFDQLFKDIIGK